MVSGAVLTSSARAGSAVHSRAPRRPPDRATNWWKGRGRGKGRGKGVEIFKNDEDKDLVGLAWAAAGFKRSSEELRSLAGTLSVNYSQLQAWIDRNIQQGEQKQLSHFYALCINLHSC